MPIARPFEFDFVARDEAATCAPELNFGDSRGSAKYRSREVAGGFLPFGVAMEQTDAMDPIQPKAAWRILSRSRRSRRTLFSRCSPHLPGSRSSLRRWRIPRYRLSTPS